MGPSWRSRSPTPDRAFRRGNCLACGRSCTEGKGHRGKQAIGAFWDTAIAPVQIEFDIQRSYACGSEVANVGTITTTASNGTSFVVEGVFVGGLSWLLAVPLSIPGARLFSDVIGDAIVEMPLDFHYSASGMLLWLLIVVLLSALASLWPALRAAQVSVRESLAYE